MKELGSTFQPFFCVFCAFCGQFISADLISHRGHIVHRGRKIYEICWLTLQKGTDNP